MKNGCGETVVRQSTGRTALASFAEQLETETPDEAISKACAHLREEVARAGWPPGLESYVKAFGCKVLEAPIPTSGRLDFENGRYVIRVRSGEGSGRGSRQTAPELDLSKATERQRFSIAHELGHALLMHGLRDRPHDLERLRDPDIWETTERLCDAAAAELLLPLDQFVGEIRRGGFAPREIERLAKEHRVSSEVVLLRFLAAGARLVSLWRVRRDRWRANNLTATLVAAYRSQQKDPKLDLDTRSSAIKPNLVLRAARSGRTRARKLIFSQGPSFWSSAGVADADEARNMGDADDVKARSRQNWARGGVAARIERANVTLLLLPASAPGAGHPLWQAGGRRGPAT